MTLPDGTTAYTRDGALKLSNTGQIVTADGFTVLPTITVPTNAADVTINAAGQVQATIPGQVNQQLLGQLQLANFINEPGLQANGDNLLSETEASGPPTVGNPGDIGFGQLQQFFLEQSNVNMVSEMTDLITAQRAYEINSKVIQASEFDDGHHHAAAVTAMIRFALLLLMMALSAWLVFSLPASAQDAADDATTAGDNAGATGLTLKESVMVSDDVVRLGDLFVEPISMGDSPVAQAPVPGQTIVLDNRFLRSLIRAYSLDWAPKTRYQRVLVGRVSHRIEPATVTAQVKDALRTYLATDKDVELSFDVGDIDFVLPTNVPSTLSVQDVRFDPASQRFAAQLVVPASGPTAISRLVAGTVYETIQLPVLSHPLAPGEVIQLTDLDWLSVRLDRVAPNAATDPKQLVGMTARRPLRDGAMLRLSDVTMAAAIKRGSVITLLVSTENMTLTAQGRALEDAAVGQPIRVVNTMSNKQLTGVVRDGATVTIPVNGAIAVN